MAVEQRAHRVAEPGRHVHAVGDVADRHLLDGAIGPQVAPHPARDLAVAAADAVRGAARAQRELAHPERLALVLGPRPAQADDLHRVDAHRRRQPRERLDDLLGGVGVVPGRDRRVRGEDRLRAGGGDAVGERAAVRARGLERDERRVALVEVQQPRLDAHRLERAHAADAEQDVLRQAGVGLADVEPRGDPARADVVLRPLGVEQVQRHPADVDAPDLGGDLGPADRHGDRDRRAVRPGHERGGQALGIGVDPVLVLPAAGVDALAEVALAVHETDRHERERAIGGLLEDVARERAEAAGVDGERAVHAELGAEVRDRPLRRGRARGGGALEVGAHGRFDLVDALEQLGVARRAGERLEAGLAEQADRVLPAALPAHRVDRGEEVVAAGRPGPAVVVREARESGQGLGYARRERLGGAQEIVVAGCHRRAMIGSVDGAWRRGARGKSIEAQRALTVKRTDGPVARTRQVRAPDRERAARRERAPHPDRGGARRAGARDRAGDPAADVLGPPVRQGRVDDPVALARRDADARATRGRREAERDAAAHPAPAHASSRRAPRSGRRARGCACRAAAPARPSAAAAPARASRTGGRGPPAPRARGRPRRRRAHGA